MGGFYGGYPISRGKAFPPTNPCVCIPPHGFYTGKKIDGNQLSQLLILVLIECMECMECVEEKGGSLVYFA